MPAGPRVSFPSRDTGVARGLLHIANPVVETAMWRLALAGVALTAAVTVADTAQAQDRRWGEGYFPNLPVVTQDGRTLRFYDDVIKGKIVVIDFIYTSCPDICGLTTARLSQAEEKLRVMVGRDLFFVSLTVDPEHDTPDKLKAFAERSEERRVGKECRCRWSPYN